MLRCTHTPLIIGTLHSPACIEKLQLDSERFKKDTGIGALEVRLDSIPTSLLPTSWPLPVIATARHPAEGGKGNLTLKQRRSLLEEALLWASAIDMELRSVKQMVSTIAQARERNCSLILSFHDFRAVPSLARLKELAARAEDAGAAIFKVAVTLNSKKELERLVEFRESGGDFPIASMGMGRLGKKSRLLLAECGSVLSYGWLYEPQVEGQWPAWELVAAAKGRK
ncbi:MAG: hypothetical protein A3F67_00970 [Verrucomicrobia bacterium RIFCSPHIGHO2_12_FULL_41_10]|nr:MAG: hypothetical protein A3F67_00970 [Verrucomicrobia bacterium RIFCSPHIGHO2_12_FULL_41_10]HLB33205.1 type I 3-dehydroquinate dehydratase [Chthoniobacterales bacterium]